MTTVEVSAPAKINITLHVTGQRADGYHLLDSLVVFADFGDRITVSPATQTRLTISGPMAKGVPTDARNLVVKAAELMGVTADIHLEKNLPTAAGLGGGSSDAAATLRALSQMAGQSLPDLAAQMTLGADVPLCMCPSWTRMRGIGDSLERLEIVQNLSLILINPGVSVPTGAVFQKLKDKNQAAMQGDMAKLYGVDRIGWLLAQRNDLETSAMALEPVIGQVLQTLRNSDNCLLARMSGSGATCFAIMRDDKARDRSVERLKRNHPEWWIRPCNVAQPRAI
jgi:4-diphosphocytidyl-2-C-methyl-D-erythritol kinase